METGNLLRGWTLSDGILLADGILLGAEIGRWEAFKTNTRRKRRRPVNAVWIEGQSDVSKYVKSVKYHRRIQDSLHEPIHGAGSVTIQDSDGVFIQNGRCTIQAGSRVKIWAGFDRRGFRHGDLVPRFAGTVKRPTINTSTGSIILDLQDYGFQMKRALTSGDWSAYNTPKLMVNELINRINLPAVTWENESGLPTTYTIGNTDLSRRNYWKLLHGALLAIGYLAYFDGNGGLQCKRRDTSSESGEVFTDGEIIRITHKRPSELINSKSFALGDADPSPWDGTASDSLRWGQAYYTKLNEQSQALYGDSDDYENEEMVYGWDNIFPFCRDAVKWFKYPRQIYEMLCPARPYLTLMDKIRVDSGKYNIHGQMTVVSISDSVSAHNFHQALLLMTHRELF